MIEETKYCSDVMKKHFNKELVMTKEDNEKLNKPTKCWICHNDYIDIDVKVRVHRYITGKYRCSAHRDCNISLRFNHKISVVFRSLKNYDSHLIMQELGKFSLKIGVIPNGLEKYMSFTISNKLSFIDSFQFLSSSFESLVQLSQQFDKNKLKLVKQKRLYPYEYTNDSEKFKEKLSGKEIFLTYYKHNVAYSKD